MSGKNYSGYKPNGDPDPTYWMGAFRKGLAFRKKAANEDSWKNWIDYYRGNFASGILPVNVMFKMIRTLVPRVYFRDPTVSITQEKPGDLYAVMAQMLERVDNKLLRQMHFKEQMKASIQDACMFGTGVIKLGFGAQYTPSPELIGTEAPLVKKEDYRVEYNSLVTGNMPWTMRVHPRNIVWPDKCSDFNSARWVAHMELMHIDDLREDPRFKHTADISPSKPIQNQVAGATKADELPEGYIQLVEFRDKKSGLVFVMAPYHANKILLCEEDTFTQQHNRFPFYPIVFNKDTEFCWGLADAKILDPQQRELNEIRTQEMRHRRHAIAKFLVGEDAITPDEAEKLDSEDVCAVVTVKDMGGVRELTAVNQMPQALLQQDANVQKEVQEIIGLGSNQFGDYAPGSADRSATEASIVDRATQIRMDERRDMVADVTEQVVIGMHSIIFENWGPDQIIDLVGDNGARFWVQVQPEYLKSGVYDVNIDPDSGLPQTAQARQQKAMNTYALLKDNAMIDQYKLLGMLLRELHGAGYDDLQKSQQQLGQEAQQAHQQQLEQMKMAITMQQFAQQNPNTMGKRGR